ncbi:gamma-aminobutyric acid receptor subunit pi [Pygocentrus nattereri]|uniref:Gamma-aminobutyric acid receptor subunit pi n=1 Tax=Pygocentrus nattereri TaxID=42514 RepID=A0AAR2KCY6_PYGNA|nr:gamma-aminobutyric acid receptor subunit pi [Pygocentrus nattereri]XP_017552150.1 gamma-aminobutyric acid receptor subunit pi [Pygocentrus nattereri]
MMTMIPSWFPLFVFIFFNRIFENSLLSAEVKEGEILPPTIQKLMKGYNKYLRPFFDNGPVTVGMSLDIASIDTISEINMDYTATIFLRQRWTDERLVFEGNKSLSLDGRLVELLWVPDTFIVDSKKSFLHDITVENRLIRIFPNGTVLYALRITTTVACNMDLTKYPMDKQTCTLQLESWGYNINDVMFYWTRGNESVSGLDTLRLAQYTVEDHYTSVSEAVYETGNYPKLIFHFELKRSILYFILETYVPSSLLVVLSWVSFWISQSSVPARICIGVTTVLTMTTLMMGARTSLPNANCFIKAIDVYLGICFSFIFGALIEYAVAHFCTLHHPDCNALMYGGHHMHDCDDDMNGIVTTIASDSSRSKRRKDSPTPAPAPTPTGEPGVVPSSPTSPEAKPPEALTEPLNRCLKNLSLIRQMLRSVNCCHVENPHYIDNYSRVTFPLSFVIVNMLYWTYYLYL